MIGKSNLQPGKITCEGCGRVITETEDEITCNECYLRGCKSCMEKLNGKMYHKKCIEKLNEVTV
jgi:hypothetical protein